MKFIHLSDPHIQKDDLHLFGLNPYERLNSAIKSVNKNFKKDGVEFLVITGDLSSQGETKSYRKLRKLIKKSKYEVLLLVGNHDNKKNFLKIFKEHPINDNFIQYTKVIENNAFIMLDTTIENSHAGDMCEKRYKWFENELKNNIDKEVYIFMHHPPFDIDIPILDKIGFKSQDKFAKLLKKYSNIKYIFFGHTHRNISGIYCNIPYLGMGSTNHQLSLKQHIKHQCTTNEEKPAYGIVTIKQEQILVHLHEFLDEDKYYMIED
ncbi:MAG: phosphodiesterase [Campylobacterota bacterium]|nr:phosphodiesterase [Campylobacterota bacterium]